MYFLPFPNVSNAIYRNVPLCGSLVFIFFFNVAQIFLCVILNTTGKNACAIFDAEDAENLQRTQSRFFQLDWYISCSLVEAQILLFYAFSKARYFCSFGGKLVN